VAINILHVTMQTKPEAIKNKNNQKHTLQANINLATNQSLKI